ncbi:MAG: endonuclease/exonuclease/phosphatase family protein [Melioribacteraceae bacterium]|nr:endonuclease/exonuclease/phosphatase family protein [Melioribacteraceae bacterium]
MKKTLFILSLLLSTLILYSQEVSQDTIYIASWNVENLFDNFDDPGKNDEEWLSESERAWTNQRIDSKMMNLARVIKGMNNLKGPDIIGFQEVEHKHLLDTLFARYFEKDKYAVAYAESPDNRGIDCGMVYNTLLFDYICTENIPVILHDKYPTRDILHVKLLLKSEDLILHTFVNHWPSRRGGLEKSEPNRLAAAGTLRKLVDSLNSSDDYPAIIIMGDFNDEPDNSSIKDILGAAYFKCDSSYTTDITLFNLSADEFINGNGTYLYRGDWNMLDQIIISNKLVSFRNLRYVCDSFEIIKPAEIITQSGRYKGASIPTFGGKSYLGGYSDHFPVGIKLKIIKD